MRLPPIRRALIATAVIAIAATVAATADDSPDELLERGKAAFHASQYSRAIGSLELAVTGFISPAAKQKYVDSGELAGLPKVETALIYLCLANEKIGHEHEARDAVLRLLYAERISPTYATLPLDPDEKGFERVAAKLVVTSRLPHNATAEAAPGAVAIASAAPVPATDPAMRSLILQLIEERAADEREAIERVAAAVVERSQHEPAAQPAETQPAHTEQRQPATSAEPSMPPAATVPAAPTALPARAAAATAQPVGAYTLQFELVCEKSSLDSARRLGGSAVWAAPITYRGRSCYRVFWGHYATKAEAERSAGEVPAKLRGGSKPVAVAAPQP